MQSQCRECRLRAVRPVSGPLVSLFVPAASFALLVFWQLLSREPATAWPGAPEGEMAQAVRGGLAASVAALCPDVPQDDIPGAAMTWIPGPDGRGGVCADRSLPGGSTVHVIGDAATGRLRMFCRTSPPDAPYPNGAPKLRTATEAAAHALRFYSHICYNSSPLQKSRVTSVWKTQAISGGIWHISLECPDGTVGFRLDQRTGLPLFFSAPARPVRGVNRGRGAPVSYSTTSNELTCPPSVMVAGFAGSVTHLPSTTNL